jgi:hypothetical protein
MIQSQFWPPPEWSECVVSWEYILNAHRVKPHELYDWCDQHVSPGRYHVHGWQSIKGFAFRFEDPQDAIVFKLRWECE